MENMSAFSDQHLLLLRLAGLILASQLVVYFSELPALDPGKSRLGQPKSESWNGNAKSKVQFIPHENSCSRDLEAGSWIPCYLAAPVVLKLRDEIRTVDEYAYTPHLDKPCFETHKGSAYLTWRWYPRHGVVYTPGSSRLHTANALLATRSCGIVAGLSVDNPSNCPPVRGFHPVDTFECLQNKTFVFVGDSLSRQQMLSLKAMLYSVLSNGSGDLVGNDGSIITFANTTIQGNAYKTTQRPNFHKTKTHFILQSPAVDGSEKIDELELRWSHMNWLTDTKVLRGEDYQFELQGTFNSLLAEMKRADVIVMNTGHWWYKGLKVKWGHELEIASQLVKKDISSRYQVHCTDLAGESCEDVLNFLAIYAVVIDRAFHVINTHYTGTTVWRTLGSSQYFNQTKDSRGNCAITEPLAEPMTDWLSAARNDILRRQFKLNNVASSERSGGTHLLLDIEQLSDLRPDAKPDDAFGVNDCTHWCLPGIPDLWNVIMLNKLCVWGEPAT